MTGGLRAAVALGAACLFSSAWQTIDYRHRLQQESEQFTWPQSEALAVLLAGVLLCTVGGLGLLATFVPISLQRIPPNPESLFFRPSFLRLGGRR